MLIVAKKFFLITIVVFFFFSPLANAGKLEELKENIVKTNQLLIEEESLHQKEEEQAMSVQKSLEERIKILEEKINEIQNENGKLEKEIEKVKIAKNDLIKKKEKSTNLLLDIGHRLSMNTKRLQNEINLSFPYILESRIERVNSLRKRLQKEGQDLLVPSGVLEISHQLWDYYIKEIDLGYNSEIYSDEVQTAKGEIKKANFLRVGRIILAYRTNDGEETGLLVKSEDGYKWKKDLSFSQRQVIKKAVEIMEGKRIPHLLEFPVEFSKLEFIGGNSDD